MNISDMHIYFRQYAQQMGMQNVRFILPEQIDLFINTSISDTTNQIIRTNVAISSNGTSQTNSKIGEVNSLRTLYKSKSVTMGNASELIDDIFLLHSVFPNKDTATPEVDGLFLIGLDVQYKRDDEDTEPFPVRLIDHQYLANTLRDAIAKPRIANPIAVFADNTLTVYFGKNAASANGRLSTDSIYKGNLNLFYIKQPDTVAYLSYDGGVDVNCDLPEFMHVDIVKRAVDLYRISVAGQSMNNPNQRPQGEESNRAQNGEGNSYRQ